MHTLRLRRVIKCTYAHVLRKRTLNVVAKSCIQQKVLPGLEPGLPGSKPGVLTNYTIEPMPGNTATSELVSYLFDSLLSNFTLQHNAKTSNVLVSIKQLP